MYGNHASPIRVHLQVPYRQGNLNRDQRSHSKAIIEVRYEPQLNIFFDEIKTYKFVDFTSQLKIGLSSEEMIYLIDRFLENAKTCLYNKKSYDVFETNPTTVIFCYCPGIKISGTLNKHPGFQQHFKMIHK